MSFKNCTTELRTDYDFCPVCGAKVIRNRLTFKNLWYDFTERYFNVDNTFLKTFIHLFKKPQEVVVGYISGVRKKYLNPVSYLGISLAVAGFLLFILRKFYLKKMNMDLFNSNLDPEVGERLFQATLDISSFLYLLYIPVVAFAGWLTFNKKQYLFPEYLVAAIYSLAHYNIFIFPASMFLLVGFPDHYLNWSPLFLLVMAFNALYIAYKIGGYALKKSIWRGLGFLFLFFGGYLGVSIFINILFFIFGVMEFQDFLPKKIN